MTKMKKLELRATYFEYFEYYVNQYLGVKKAKMFLTQLDNELKVFARIAQKECDFRKGDFMFFSITEKQFWFFSVNQKQNFLKVFNNLIFKFHVIHSDFFFKSGFNKHHDIIKHYIDYFFETFKDNYNHDYYLKTLIDMNFSQDIVLKKTVVFRILMLTFNSLEFKTSDDNDSFCFDIKKFCIFFGSKLFNFCFEVFDIFKSLEAKQQYLSLILAQKNPYDIDLLQKYCKDGVLLHRSIIKEINCYLISETTNRADLINNNNDFFYKLGYCMFNFFVKTDTTYFSFTNDSFCVKFDVVSITNAAFEGSELLYDFEIFNAKSKYNKISKKSLYLKLLKLDDSRLGLKLEKIKSYYNMNLLEFDKMLKFNRATTESAKFKNFCFDFASNEPPRIHQPEYNERLLIFMFQINNFLTKLYMRKILLHEKLFRTIILSCVVNCGINNKSLFSKNVLSSIKIK